MDFIPPVPRPFENGDIKNIALKLWDIAKQLDPTTPDLPEAWTIDGSNPKPFENPDIGNEWLALAQILASGSGSAPKIFKGVPNVPTVTEKNTGIFTSQALSANNNGLFTFYPTVDGTSGGQPLFDEILSVSFLPYSADLFANLPNVATFLHFQSLQVVQGGATIMDNTPMTGTHVPDGMTFYCTIVGILKTI